MGRRKVIDVFDPKFDVRELLIQHQMHPLDALLNKLKETLPWPDADFLKENPNWIPSLVDKGWEPYIEDGKKRLRVGLGKYLEVMAKVAPFVSPTLKGMEVKETRDYNFNITIESYREGEKDTENVITIPVEPLQVANGD